MKILLVHNRYRSGVPSGEDGVVDQEGAALTAKGHEVERFERCSDEIATRSVVGKALVPVQVLWNDEIRRSLTGALRAFRPDVVHVHNTFPLLSPSVLYACRAERTPVAVTLHNYRLICAAGGLSRGGEVCHDCIGHLPFSALRHGCYRDSTLATLPLAVGLVAHAKAWRRMVSAYVFLSRSQRDIFVGEGLPIERSFVKPNFVTPVSAPAAVRDRVVVGAGRLTVEKGVPLLMEAWDRYISEAGEDRLRLVVAGAGPLENEVSSWAASRPSVEWVGMLSRGDCRSLVARSQAVVVPSKSEETFGLLAVEAMAAGVPPLAPAHGSFPELISDGADGILFPPGDASALAAVFRDVDEHPDRYAALGRAARATYEQRFAPEANLKQLLEIYEFAIENRTN